MEKSSQLLNQEKFILEPKITATITHKKIPLTLRSSFGTSHSSTTIRYNSFIQIIINEEGKKPIYGIGESGLPPKKPGCYLADCDDICSYIKDYFSFLNSILKDISSHTNQEQYEKNFTKIIKENTKLLPYYIYILFYAMDNCPGNKFDYSNAAKNCLEGALWDLAGKITNLSLLELLKIPIKENISTFYTVTIAPDEEMINCLNLGLKYTNYIKIKLNKDIEKAKHTLKLLDEKCKEYESNKKHKCVWSLDINSDFVDPSQFEIMLNDVLLNYKERIYMIEQAFPIKFNDIKAHLDGWKKVKEIAEKNNILIFADESASTVESIEPLKDIVSGVNIKLEKCGGIRNGLKCVEKAKELNLKIWIGSMVGSSLLMSMAATLTPLSTYSDLDGFLLVDEESQPGTGGFKWDADNGTIILSQAPGLGVRLKTKDELL